MVNNIEIVLRALIVHNHKILICQSSDKPPIYYLPGGHLEVGEKMAGALKREVKEEIGTKITNLKFLEFFENLFTQNNVYHHEINFLYRVDLVCKNPATIISQEDHISILWLNLDKLPSFELLPVSIKQYLLKYFNQ